MKELQRIREKYSSAGDIIFRSAVGYLVSCGSDTVMMPYTDTPEGITGRVIECAKEIGKLNRDDAISELLNNKVYIVVSSGFTPEREVVGVYRKLEDAKARFEQEKKAINDYIADSDEYSVYADDDYYFAVIHDEDSFDDYETMIITRTIE